MQPATADQPFVFSPSGAGPGLNAAPAPDPLVVDTRREIADIVREIASAVRSDCSRSQFLSRLADRVLRAMAAEGVVIWQVDPAGEIPFSVAHRIGRTTDRSILAQSQSTHYQMLAEVVAGGQPVVVPSTPDAVDPTAAANPAAVPAAVVPIHSDPLSARASYVLEVFLESDCGVATQRGYLRFVAQMADLAGEFLRNDQLRELHRKHRIAQQVDTFLATLHTLSTTHKIEAYVVDSVADLFGLDRVGMCYVRDSDVRLVAVSHCNVIDRHGIGAKQIESVADEHFRPSSCEIFEYSSESGDSDSLIPITVASSDEHEGVCIVGLGNEHSQLETDLITEPLQRIAYHVGLAIRHRRSIEAIPGGRAMVAMANQLNGSARRRWHGPLITVALMTIVLVIALFPVPMVVTSPAALRPANVQMLFAPRSAVVDAIHVSHGESVHQGQKLLTMSDPELEQQITSLVGRRAVLTQKQAAFTTALVDAASYRTDRSEQLQGERSLLAEELQTIDDQLAVLKRVQDSLELRASCDGVVDAWQIERRMLGRPANRGDALLEVIAKETTWLVDARVPLARIESVRQAAKLKSLRVAAVIEGTDGESLPASIDSIGPALRTSTEASDSKAVVLRLDSFVSESGSIDSLDDSGPVSGAPVRVLFRCESSPLVSVLFHDAIDSVYSMAGLYFSTGSSNDFSDSSTEGIHHDNQ
ncbi:hypothetical protein CA13_33050 [Planctomycetes bacterium CA13]|uniref:HlyD family secretion protein n=1 Tax=Novipirellula herctigrandis TaxID=2527986 RepID=A0A5C5Z394_9BACT|nr:hypothetical protein CA13_33050 [Planctomycetes bacterium CA13]